MHRGKGRQRFVFDIKKDGWLPSLSEVIFLEEK